MPKKLKNLFWRYKQSKDIEHESLIIDAMSSYYLNNYDHKPRVFVDVGANCGSWSDYAMSKFDVIHCFEPDDELYRYLKRRFKNSNICIYNEALSDFNGSGNLYIPTNNGNEIKSRASLCKTANAGFEQLILESKISTLDSCDFSDVNCIKIDVEGNELAVLKGGEETLKQYKPVLIVEIEERHHIGESILIFNYLSGLGYMSLVFDGSLLENINKVRFEEIVANKSFNNFVFIHNDLKEMGFAIKELVSDFT